MFADGDSVTILLKDRSKKQSSEELDWYEKAFGKKRNLMKFTIFYKPMVDLAKKGNFDFFVKVKYQMFPEMFDEFDPNMYPSEQLLQMEAD